MLETLQKHLQGSPKICVVKAWIDTLPEEHQNTFKEIVDKSKEIHIASLYKDLQGEAQLPFKLTAFRSHLRGYCTCQ